MSRHNGIRCSRSISIASSLRRTERDVLDRAAMIEFSSVDIRRRVDDTNNISTTKGQVAMAAGKRFEASPYHALRSIICEFHEGVLVLNGRVSSYHLKQLAQETVRSLAGVSVIFNIVEVNLLPNHEYGKTVPDIGGNTE